ncbi:MAG: hypothetical protein NTW16_16280 [Bacteroidetes bacterium]|nr:hypothetical protein [Bacteroidota bacterium]
MEISQKFIENAIFGEYIYDCFRNDDFDPEFFAEIHKMILVENEYEERIIRVIASIKIRKYQEARIAMPCRNELASELEQRRCVVLSLLKGIMATSSMASPDEIADARIRWIRYHDQQDSYDPQGYHNQVYREFIKVKSLEDLGRFNIFFHNYILDLVFGLAEIYIKRLRYAMEHLRGKESLEEACAKGAMNLEKFEHYLGEIKTFNPATSDI